MPREAQLALRSEIALSFVWIKLSNFMLCYRELWFDCINGSMIWRKIVEMFFAAWSIDWRMKGNLEALRITTTQIIDVIIICFQHDEETVLESGIDRTIRIRFVAWYIIIVAIINIPSGCAYHSFYL